jgi:hypothetical protein
MVRLMALVVAVSLLSGLASAADKKDAPGDAKELSGMSVLGNNETPKALYIVPWKGSEIGDEADLRAGLLNDAMAPVDKEVFMRELEFYQVRGQETVQMKIPERAK